MKHNRRKLKAFGSLVVSAAILAGATPALAGHVTDTTGAMTDPTGVGMDSGHSLGGGKKEEPKPEPQLTDTTGGGTGSGHSLGGEKKEEPKQEPQLTDTTGSGSGTSLDSEKKEEGGSGTSLTGNKKEEPTTLEGKAISAYNDAKSTGDYSKLYELLKQPGAIERLKMIGIHVKMPKTSLSPSAKPESGNGTISLTPSTKSEPGNGTNSLNPGTKPEPQLTDTTGGGSGSGHSLGGEKKEEPKPEPQVTDTSGSSLEPGVKKEGEVTDTSGSSLDPDVKKENAPQLSYYRDPAKMAVAKSALEELNKAYQSKDPNMAYYYAKAREALDALRNSGTVTAPSGSW